MASSSSSLVGAAQMNPIVIVSGLSSIEGSYSMKVKFVCSFVQLRHPSEENWSSGQSLASVNLVGGCLRIHQKGKIISKSWLVGATSKASDTKCFLCWSCNGLV